MSNALHLVAACAAMVVLVLIVALRMLHERVAEMRAKRIHPQTVATSNRLAARVEHVQAADNFRNLFEVPVLLYALCAIALADGAVPGWMVPGVWAFVALRYVHSLIQCSYNRVMHRFVAFFAGLLLMAGMWIAYAVQRLQGGGA